MICREPFDVGKRTAFDHPLSTHFEEPDALLIFDDVLVPWDRVFLHGRVDLANRMYSETALRNHTAHQTGVRAIAKMQLAVGVAMAVAETVKSNGFLHVQEMLGEIIGYIELAKSCVIREIGCVSLSLPGTWQAMPLACEQCNTSATMQATRFAWWPVITLTTHTNMNANDWSPKPWPWRVSPETKPISAR